MEEDHQTARARGVAGIPRDNLEMVLTERRSLERERESEKRLTKDLVRTWLDVGRCDAHLPPVQVLVAGVNHTCHQYRFWWQLWTTPAISTGVVGRCAPHLFVLSLVYCMYITCKNFSYSQSAPFSDIYIERESLHTTEIMLSLWTRQLDFVVIRFPVKDCTSVSGMSFCLYTETCTQFIDHFYFAICGKRLKKLRVGKSYVISNANTVYYFLIHVYYDTFRSLNRLINLKIFVLVVGKRKLKKNRPGTWSAEGPGNRDSEASSSVFYWCAAAVPTHQHVPLGSLAGSCLIGYWFTNSFFLCVN